ncbi:MAG: hypothetical protein SFY96_01465 [Planctomycetota bacterium]|nr:hypothetical protein [Planctomycetota bacterium]
MAHEVRTLRYRCVAASVEGLIQQVAVSYIRTGHFFYVSGRLGPDTDAAAVDAKLINKYGVDVSRWTRALRKQRGEANLQYIRYGRFFLLLATHGVSLFFELEGEQVHDCRRMPIKFAGYSLSYRGGHPHVRIDMETYLGFKAAMVQAGLALDRAGMEELFAMPRFVPYAPVRRQLWNVWREVNRARTAAGLDPLREECLNLRRRIVRPFGELRGVRAIVNEQMSVEGDAMIDEPSDGLSWDGLCGPNTDAFERAASPPGSVRPHEGVIGEARPVSRGVSTSEPATVFPVGWGDGVGDDDRTLHPPSVPPGIGRPGGGPKGPVKGSGREPGR